MKFHQHTTPGKGLRAVAAAVLLPAGLPAPAAQTGMGSHWVGGEEERGRARETDRWRGPAAAAHLGVDGQSGAGGSSVAGIVALTRILAGTSKQLIILRST